MSHQRVLQVGIAVVLVILFLVGCGGSAPTAVVEAPTATSAPEQAAATLTPEPPAATPTPEPPTATPTPSGPKAGQWEGPIVRFNVTSDSNINNFRMVIKADLFSCGIEVEEIVIEPDGTFAFKRLDPLNKLNNAEKNFLKENNIVTPVETDKGEEFEVLRINGKFTSDTILTGDVWILSCEGRVFAPGTEGTWKAEWKE